jgi:hypothetical protein
MYARIYKPSKTAMQSGTAKVDHWVLEFEPTSAVRPDALTGWASTTETASQVTLTFETREAAVDFARERGIPHRVITPAEPRRIIKSYADNFATRRREPWSH